MDSSDISIENLDKLIEKYMPFLIKTVSNFTGRYVSIENDEEFSIAISAFAEAVEKYDSDRGSFLSFVRLVTESRLKSHFSKKKNELEVCSLDKLRDDGIDFTDTVDERSVFSDEIAEFQEELNVFGLTLEKLADKSPKHRDTRIISINIAEKASEDEEIVSKTYEKRKLPIRRTAFVAKVTEKIVKRNKCFILAVMIIFVKRFSCLVNWIGESRCEDVS